MKNLPKFLKDKELYDYCEKRFHSIYNRLFPNASILISKEEARDIQSEALIRVFKKRHLWRKKKGSLFGYANAIIINSIKNSMRERFGDNATTPRIRRLRFAVNFPRHLQCKVVQTNIYGEEKVVIEPDMADPSTFLFEQDNDRQEFAETLTGDDKKVFDMVSKGETLTGIAQKFHIRHPSNAYPKIKRLSKLFINYTKL